ncbi:MAG TPA: DUF2934 domain-containing protein [Tepidisphaeraceae bacterium]|jgi:hypothetical protein|nr:DUF2934 domain-containing protein [Tepidisphaeraceae bacterium]
MTDSLYGQFQRSRSSSDFVAILEKAITCMDKMLCYRGSDRFVIFYHEPRAEEVLWRDSHSYGFVAGAWSTFMDEVAPVADHYKVNVGCTGTAPTHVLLIDREDRRGYFALKKEALEFLARFAGDSPDNRSAAVNQSPDTRIPGAMVEITNEEITKLAHQLWEQKGRPQGQDLQVWLEAEAELKSGNRVSAATG